MKNYMTPALFAAAFISVGTVAHAADLKNMDAVSYTLYVETEEATKTVVIGPNETIKDICVDCYIAIEDNDSDISIATEPKLVIKNGQLVIEE
ncbi:hypothetical protein [Paremcibacter congregatus]|uniref:Uncharacterized protein n=1 Tax=Paremcibacter congregatus TaxID=2043170 RepID=A0A2G4YMI8_9PROT|nr:hypothetical protein [Paremcibacter congregatus]PHZ83549.1 hypothetical protein CRD36_16420 [Paremcibacter congregatus]QDE28365.1 hypothetical protein FIV45_14350 [Paremcibacter congregatus]|tara:strand:- start:19617 stop:19895 length:279 start_codon:yes stop_codon:yes gene_type:complete